MPHIQTQTELETQMAKKILDFLRSELYIDLRFLDIALSALIPKADTALQTFATDGISLFYPPDRILYLFRQNARFLSRAFLHSVLHCIFSHLWIAGDRHKPVWNIACDIAVEYTIDHMDVPCTRRILTWQRQQVYEQMDAGSKGISAAILYRDLSSLTKEQLSALQKEFYTDDHCYWPLPKRGTHTLQQPAQKQWDKIARQTYMQQKQQGTDASENSRLLKAQIQAGKSKRSYADFLKKFAVYREELQCDPDEFDLNYYTYGLQLYGSMPLIEPVETREVHKIQEFVIVLDTSDSTSGSLIKNFLQETLQILQQQGSFFRKCRIRIIQCDDQVRKDQELCDLDRLDGFLERFTLIGGGGTDFRPAFSYVNDLLEQGILHHLNGLLYFTDGKGTYPKKKPPYQTAFLFLNEFDDAKLPPWALHLRLEPEEFMTTGKKQEGIL